MPALWYHAVKSVYSVMEDPAMRVREVREDASLLKMLSELVVVTVQSSIGPVLMMV